MNARKKPRATILADNGVITRPQLVAELGYTDETIARMEREDGFPHRRAGRFIFYDVDAIKEWIRAGNQPKGE